MEDSKHKPTDAEAALASSDAELAEAWDQFCDQLKAAKDVIFGDKAPSAQKDRAAGIRYLSRNIAVALDKEFENADPLHPELTHIMDWRRKYGDDNADSLYHRAPINGTDTYRVSGTRGSVGFIAFTVAERDNSTATYAPVGSLFGHTMHLEDDGRFEVFLSPEPPDPCPPNWIRTSPNTIHMTIRQFFGDWENEEPMGALRIDRLGSAVPPPDISVASVTAGLLNSAKYFNNNCTYWNMLMERWQDRPLAFLPFRPVSGNANATPGGEVTMLYWSLPADEALIIRVVPPRRADFWNFGCGNFWFETLDYQYRLAGTNHHHAVLEEDGELILVLSHDDPGLPNWIDTSGYSAGYLINRWIGADSLPQPKVERVKRADLFTHLPSSIRRISAAERQEQLAARRRGVMRRFANI